MQRIITLQKQIDDLNIKLKKHEGDKKKKR